MLTVETYATLSEAAGALRERGRYLGGGTLVMRAANYADQGFERIVRSRDPGLREIRGEGTAIRIGAGVTMAMIAQSAELAFLAPAARAVGGPAVRNMATIGGNLFAETPYGDVATALLALDAGIQMADGTRLPLEQFLQSRDTQRGLVAAISVPRPGQDAFRFRKVSRVKPKGVAVMTLAAWLPLQGGRVSGARVAFGAMGPTPMRARAVENALEGVTLDENGISRALAVATDGLSPADDSLASAWYRREVAPVHLKRLLLGEGRA